MKSAREYDVIILGQGLAGTALAWEYLFRGYHPLIIDRAEPVTSSKIAAGMMPPLTGKRFSLGWRFPSLLATAVDFYRKIEQRTQTCFLYEREYIRLFRSKQERTFFREQRQSECQDRAIEVLSRNDSSLRNLHAPYGALRLPAIKQLQTASYLDCSRRYFQQEDRLLQADLDLQRDLQVDATGVMIPRLQVRARRLICCCGAADRLNPWFSWMRFLPAKGEMLTFRKPRTSAQEQNRILSRGIWTAPVGSSTFRLGATYDSRNLDQVPTPQGRDWLIRQWEELSPATGVEILEHAAAIRPAMFDQRPALGSHPDFPQLGILNGLGSKGSCQAPWLAGHLADHLESGSPLLPEVSLLRKGNQCQT